MGLRWRAVIPIAVAMVLGVLVYCTQWQSLGRRSTSWPQSTDLDQHLASWQQSTGVSQECATCSTSLRVMTKASAMMGTSVRTKVSAVAKASAKSTVDSPHLTPQGNLLEMDRGFSEPVSPTAPCSGANHQAFSPERKADILTAGPFISQSKNPCWWNGTRGITQSRLHCLPYFFLAGVSKCGSTDIFSRLSGHPQVIPPSQKEPRWFDWRRFASGDYSFQWYVSNFMQAAWQISRDISKFGMSGKVVGDGSPTYFWRNFHWEEYSGNEGCTQPRVLIPDIIQPFLPHAKIILSFRNPVDSIYSKYLAEADKGAFRSPEHFHSLVEKEILHYQDCFTRSSVRSCAYNITLSTEAEVRLEKGLYAIFLADWFRVFPRKQIHVIRFEDYIADIAGHLQRMFDFLDLDAMPDNALRNLAALPPAHTGRHYDVGHMRPATKRLLQQFYATFNACLADLMGDKRFLWLP